MYTSMELKYQTEQIRDFKLHAHDEIAIVYGTPPSTIPSSYKSPERLRSYVYTENA
jgi:hypothetical protein